MRLLRNLVLSLFVLAILGAAAAAAGAYWWLNKPLPMSPQAPEISIEMGATPREIAQAWVKAGVRTHPRLLFEWFRWSGQARKIRAGNYEAEPGMTPQTLLNMMIRGDETLSFVRFTEGWTFRQMRAEMAKADGLKQTIANLSDAEVMNAIGEPGVPAEGHFFPDSYSYTKGSTDVALLKRARRAMQRELTAAWNERASDTPLKSSEELLTLASIVEKETGLAADRTKVAAVFANRLKVNMPLQTDPTVIYGLGSNYDGSLHKRDLQTDSPYNTYLRAGLPPTPISMPGRASLLATVRPEATKALYFVSRGDGSSHFSESLNEHNRAVNQYVRAPAAARAASKP